MTERAKYLVCSVISAAASAGSYVSLKNGSTRLSVYFTLVICAVAAVGFMIAAIVAFVNGDDR